MPQSLAGKVAAVTGAGSGLGRACAVALGAAGAAIVANDVALDGLRETADEVVAAGGQVEVVVGDIRNREDVTKIIAAAQSRFDGLDIMVANAGVSKYVPFEEATDDDLDVVLDTNLRGALLCAQAAIPALRARQGGSILFISSVQAFVTLPGCVAYAAAKAGLIAAARALAVEVGREGIRVNAIAPGVFDTPMLHRDLDGMNVDEASGFLARVEGANVLGRIGRPDEIGDVVVFLTSDAASYITGTTVVVDGGYLAVKAL
jgi:NAD(P)-dependent dehydrogenase (short-subunit alcohol dehydrogenase family)